MEEGLRMRHDMASLLFLCSFPDLVRVVVYCVLFVTTALIAPAVLQTIMLWPVWSHVTPAPSRLAVELCVLEKIKIIQN